MKDEICEYCGTGHPPDQVANPHYCIARLIEESDRLYEAIVLTLNENSRLADGDDCTLWRLKKVIGKRE